VHAGSEIPPERTASSYLAFCSRALPNLSSLLRLSLFTALTCAADHVDYPHIHSCELRPHSFRAAFTVWRSQTGFSCILCFFFRASVHKREAPRKERKPSAAALSVSLSLSFVLSFFLCVGCRCVALLAFTSVAFCRGHTHRYLDRADRHCKSRRHLFFLFSQ
jgi:hypothetical protein